jgi:hypothetical protein
VDRRRRRRRATTDHECREWRVGLLLVA